MSAGILLVFASIFELVPSAAEVLQSFHPLIAFSIEYLIQFLILFFPLWFLVVDKYNLSLKDFGFKKVGLGKVVKTVLLSYVLYLFLSAALTSFLYALGWTDIPGYQAQEPYLPLFGTDALGLTGAFLIIVFLAPFLEELFFRGYLYQTCLNRWSIWWSSFISAALFSLFHFQLQSFFPLFILGLILNYNFQKTGSVWTSMAFHSLNNAIAFGMEVYLYFHPEFLNTLSF